MSHDRVSFFTRSNLQGAATRRSTAFAILRAARLSLRISASLNPDSYDRVYRLTEPFRLGEVAFLLWLVILGAREKKDRRTGEVRTARRFSS